MPKTIFISLASFVIRKHRFILLGAIGLTVLSFLLITQLRIDFSLDSLIPSNDPRAQQLLADLEDTGSQDVLVALVTIPGIEHLDDGKLVVDEFVSQMLAFPSIVTIDARITVQQQKFFAEVLLPHAALFLSDKECRDLLERLSDFGIYQQIKENKRFLLMPMQGRAGELILRDPLGLRTLWLSRWLGEQTFGNMEIVDGYLVDRDRRHLLVFIRPKESARNIEYTKTLMAAAQTAVDNAIGTWRQSHPAPEESPTITFAGGYPIALADEALTRKDLQNTIIVSLVGVNLLFYLVFRNLRILLLMLVPLSMGIIWTFGCLRLIFGHVNVITGAFGGVLLGLGTDFAIYLLNLYLAAYRTQGHSNALRLALAKSGPGVLLGGLTSAAGFLTLGISSFPGFRELGVITGLGMLFCLLSMLLVLPALLVWQHERGWTLRQVPPISNFGLERLFSVVQRHHRWMVGGSVVVLGFLGISAVGISFDDDLRSLRPQQSGYQSAQKELESILGGTGGYLLLAMEDENRNVILNRALTLNKVLERLQAEGRLAHYRSVLSYLPAPVSQQRALEFLAAHGAELSPERIEATFRLAIEENGFHFLPEYDSYLEWLKTFLQPHGEVSPETFAQAGLSSLLAPFLIRHDTVHKLITYIYPRTGLWVKSDLEKLMTEVQQAVEESLPAGSRWRLGGLPILTYCLKEHVVQDLNKTVILAGLAIVVLVLVAFRHVLPAILATIPMVAALLTMLGFMALASVPFNYVNFVVLPMMIGICINDGVLMISYWLHEPELQLTVLLRQIGRAILLTSLTTLTGFGSLVCSHYPGLRSIGWLAGLSIFAELSASLVFLPAVLAWMAAKQGFKRAISTQV
jgi:uncharacterized protein